MPNWCHNTLTVRGGEAEVARFVAAVRESDEQPLSFAKLAPEPSDAEYAALDEKNKADCRLCAGKGKRPVTQEEADAWGIEFYGGIMPVLPFDDRRPCNGCSGSGRALPFGVMEAWYRWRLGNWGTKWDASFNGPFMALGVDGSDVDLSVEAQGGTFIPGVAIYKFDTAWSPPAPFVEAASDQYPELEFVLRYGEPGNGYAGSIRYVGGLCIEEEDLEVEDVLAPEEMWF